MDEQYTFEKSKIVQGDCLKKMKSIPDKSIDFICCDLPYGSTANNWDSPLPLTWNFEGKEEDDFFLTMYRKGIPYDTAKALWKEGKTPGLWQHYERIIKDDGAIALFGTGLFAHKLALSKEKMYKYAIVWHKSKSGSAFTAKYRPVNKHENILIFGKGKVKYNPQLVEGKPYYRKRKANNGDKPNNHKLGVVSESETKNDGFRYPSTVQFFQQKWRRQDQVHPKI